MIRQICMYCECDLGAIDDGSGTAEELSHGLCKNCLPRFFSGKGTSMVDFLDSLPCAVFMVDSDARLLHANALGARLTGKDPLAVRGQLGGDVFECRHAREPGGCGRTIHCKTCTIRRCVDETFTTRRPCLNQPAHMDLADVARDRSVRFLVSTKPFGDVVLLEVGDLGPIAAD